MNPPLEIAEKTDVTPRKTALARSRGFLWFRITKATTAAWIPPEWKRNLIFVALIGFILWLAFLPGIVALVKAEETQPITITKKQLKTAAYNSLWRLKRSMERDGFSSSRVALNVWRSNAIDAGIFKPDEYEQYKRQIYEKSITSNQLCFDRAVEALNYTDANKCLLTWRLHTEEIDLFDPARYDEMNVRLQAIKDQKPQETEP